jgi:hypothetical protein
MTHSDPFDYFEDAPSLSGGSLLADFYVDVIDEWDDPAFALLDDAGGRFVVDRRTGLISLADETLLETERGSLYQVRLQGREASSDLYEMTLTLKINGMMPSMVTSDDAPLVGLEAVHIEPAPETAEVARLDGEAAHLPWRDYAAFFAQDGDFPSPHMDALFGVACDFGLEERYDLNDAALTLVEPAPPPISEEHWF